MLVEGTVVVVIYQLHQQHLHNLMREPMQSNSAEEFLKMRIFFRSMLASLVEELERRSTRLLACQAQWEISLQAGETADLMHCYEQYVESVSYTHLRAHETPEHLVCRLLLEKKKNK